MKEIPDTWWGDFSLKLGASAQWEIGPTRIAVQRLAREWLVAHEQIDGAESQLEWRFDHGDLDQNWREFAHVSRYVCQSTPEQITVIPALADRSVVSRPFAPFIVPVDENATLYISTPLWFVLTTGSPAQTLFEIPIQRPSDTWFGPSTLEGETCYASRTHGRLNLENLTIYPYRAITQVHITNNAAIPLLVERLNVPVPYLSLFYTQEGILFTETVTYVQTGGTSLVEFKIEKDSLPSAAGATLTAPPRQAHHKGMLVRAFGALKFQVSD